MIGHLPSLRDDLGSILQTSLHLTAPFPTSANQLLLTPLGSYHRGEEAVHAFCSLPQDPGEEDTLQVPQSKLHKGWRKIRAVVWRQGTRDKRRPALCVLQFRCQGRIQQTGLWQEMDESGLHPWVWGAVTCLRIQAKPAEGNRRRLQLKPSGSIICH